MSHPVRRIFATLDPNPGGPTDAELLARFAADRDAGAFELLVWRHAALVLRTCRGVLRDHQAAEDATQAVFLALARQAGSVGRNGAIAGWLFRVARRVAARATRRRALPTVPSADLDRLPAPVHVSAPDPDTELILHEELARLPERYRVPVLMCFFEGLTHAEAARRLGVPVGTVAGRMARAKDALAARLARRGVPLSLLTPVAIAAAPSFAAATTRAAVAFAARSCSDVSGPVLDLVKRELRMTAVKKILGVVAVAAVVCGCLAFGLRSSAEPPTVPPPAPHPGVPDKTPTQKPPAVVMGKTFAIAPVTTDLQHRLLDRSPNATVVVLMDGTPLFKDPKTLDVEAFDLVEMRKGLRTFPKEKNKSVAHIAVHYAHVTNPMRDGAEMADWILEGAVRQSGFVPTNTSNTSHNGTFGFAEFVAPLKAGTGAGESEAGVGDDRVQAYPVRTPLSRVLTRTITGVGKATYQSADGVVDVLAPLDCRGDDWLPPEVDKSVERAIEKLKLAKGQRLNFRLHVTKRDDQTSVRLLQTCNRWANENGLEAGQWSY